MGLSLRVKGPLIVEGVRPPLVRVEAAALQVATRLSLLAAEGRVTLGRLNVLVRRLLRIFRR